MKMLRRNARTRPGGQPPDNAPTIISVAAAGSGGKITCLQPVDEELDVRSNVPLLVDDPELQARKRPIERDDAVTERRLAGAGRRDNVHVHAIGAGRVRTEQAGNENGKLHREIPGGMTGQRGPSGHLDGVNVRQVRGQATPRFAFVAAAPQLPARCPEVNAHFRC